MARVGVSRSDNDDYESFLYDYVGEDENGVLVTVLSALARLGVNPWQEASELAKLPVEDAVTRLDAMIAGMRDVPSLVDGHGATARRLIGRLPRRGSRSAAVQSPAPGRRPSEGASRGASNASFLRAPGAVVVLIVLAVLVLAQIVSFGVATP